MLSPYKLALSLYNILLLSLLLHPILQRPAFDCMKQAAKP